MTDPTRFSIPRDDLLALSQVHAACKSLLGAAGAGLPPLHTGKVRLSVLFDTPAGTLIELFQQGPQGALRTRAPLADATPGADCTAAQAGAPPAFRVLTDASKLHASLLETPPGATLHVAADQAPTPSQNALADGRLAVRNDRCKARFRLPTADAALYPEPPLADPQAPLVTEKAILLQTILDRTRFACNAEDALTTAITGAVFLDPVNPAAAATNGHRLAWSATGGAGALPPEPGQAQTAPLLPRVTADAIAALLKDRGDQAIALRLHGNGSHLAVTLEQDAIVLYARLIDTTYPSCGHLVPETQYVLDADRRDLEAELRRAAVAWDGGGPPRIRMAFDPQAQRCVIRGGQHTGSTGCTVAYEGLVDVNLHAAPVNLQGLHLDARYLLEGITRATPGDRVRIAGEDKPDGPLLVTDPDSPGDGGYLMMPLAA